MSGRHSVDPVASSGQVEKSLVYGTDIPEGAIVGINPADNKVYPFVMNNPPEPGKILYNQKVALLSKSLAVIVYQLGTGAAADPTYVRAGSISNGQVTSWGSAVQLPLTYTSMGKFDICAVNATQFVVAANYVDTALTAYNRNAVMAGSVAGTTITTGGANCFAIANSASANTQVAVCNVDETRFAVAYIHDNTAGRSIPNIRICDVAGNNTITLGTANPFTNQALDYVICGIACVDAGNPIKLVILHETSANADMMLRAMTFSNVAPYGVTNTGADVNLSAAANYGNLNACCCRANTGTVGVAFVAASSTTLSIAAYTVSGTAVLTQVGSTLAISINGTTSLSCAAAGTNLFLVRHYYSNATSGSISPYNDISLISTNGAVTKVDALFLKCHYTPRISSVLDGGVYYWADLLSDYYFNTGVDDQPIYAVVCASVSASLIQYSFNKGFPVGVTKETGLVGETHPVVVKGTASMTSPRHIWYYPPRIYTTATLQGGNAMHPVSLVTFTVPTIRLVEGDRPLLVVKPISSTEVLLCI